MMIMFVNPSVFIRVDPFMSTLDRKKSSSTKDGQPMSNSQFSRHVIFPYVLPAAGLFTDRVLSLARQNTMCVIRNRTAWETVKIRVKFKIKASTMNLF